MSESTSWEEVYRVQTVRIEELEAENAALRRVPLTKSQANKMYARLQAAEAKVAELEVWVEEHGERGNTCTFNILRNVCSYCRCKRKKEQGDE